MYNLINISRLQVLLPAMEENATLRSPEEMDYLEVAFLLWEEKNAPDHYDCSVWNEVRSTSAMRKVSFNMISKGGKGQKLRCQNCIKLARNSKCGAGETCLNSVPHKDKICHPTKVHDHLSMLRLLNILLY